MAISATAAHRVFQGLARTHLDTAASELMSARNCIRTAAWDASGAIGLHEHLKTAVDHTSSAVVALQQSGDTQLLEMAFGLNEHLRGLARTSGALNDVVNGANGLRPEFRSALRATAADGTAELAGHLGPGGLSKLAEATFAARHQARGVQPQMQSLVERLSAISSPSTG